MMTAQMRREGEGECNRLIMWLVALRLRERMKRKKRQTQTDKEAGGEVMRKKEERETRTKGEKYTNSVSIISLPFTLQRRPGPSTG